jgi:hypothetical protein
MSPVGTFETCRPSRRMSVFGGISGSRSDFAKLSRMTPNGHLTRDETVTVGLEMFVFPVPMGGVALSAF